MCTHNICFHGEMDISSKLSSNSGNHITCICFTVGLLFEPSHEIMVLFILRKFILQMHMRSHPVGLDV